MYANVRVETKQFNWKIQNILNILELRIRENGPKTTREVRSVYFVAYTAFEYQLLLDLGASEQR